MPAAGESNGRAAARDRLLAAAEAAFADKGFHGTTTRDISARADVSAGGLYVYHRSKEELLYEISRKGHEATLELMREAVAEHTEPEAQLRHLVRCYVRHHAQAHTRARILNYELAALSEPHRAHITLMRREMNRIVRSLIERGIGSGVFRSSQPRMTTVAILSLGIDVARWFRDGGEWSPDEIAEHYQALALRMLGVD